MEHLLRHQVEVVLFVNIIYNYLKCVIIVNENIILGENTIASLKKAGLSGAKWVEFDVQLSKDLCPVVYHDFHVYVSLRKKATLDTNDMLEMPMRELTFEQLRNLKVYHTVEGKNREAKFFDENLQEHQPFPCEFTIMVDMIKSRFILKFTVLY